MQVARSIEGEAAGEYIYLAINLAGRASSESRRVGETSPHWEIVVWHRDFHSSFLYAPCLPQVLIWTLAMEWIFNSGCLIDNHNHNHNHTTIPLPQLNPPLSLTPAARLPCLPPSCAILEQDDMGAFEVSFQQYLAMNTWTMYAIGICIVCLRL